jgi:hypothetical protein
MGSITARGSFEGGYPDNASLDWIHSVNFVNNKMFVYSCISC